MTPPTTADQPGQILCELCGDWRLRPKATHRVYIDGYTSRPACAACAEVITEVAGGYAESWNPSAAAKFQQTPERINTHAPFRQSVTPWEAAGVERPTSPEIVPGKQGKHTFDTNAIR